MKKNIQSALSDSLRTTECAAGRFLSARFLRAALCAVVTAATAGTLAAQQSEMIIKLTNGELPVIAVPDFRGSGDAQRYMDTFNGTLFSALQDSGLFKMAPKSMYPTEVPQQPSDFKPPTTPTRVRRGQPSEPKRNGPWLTDWSSPPVSASWLAFGYTAVQNNQIVLFGWLFNVTQPNVQSAQVFGKLYFGSVDEA
ncbi:MAG: hypothetical protein ACRD9L_28675, partial [Bryobacteraceae bacterium]